MILRTELTKRTRVFAIAAIVAGVPLATMARVHAQTAPATVAGVSRQRPDVQVVVVPVSGGQWEVSEVYAGQVSAEKAKERLTNLFKVSGWLPTSPLAFEDAALDVGNVAKPGSPAAAPSVMSSVRCTLNGAVVNRSQGTIDVAPFVQSLREMDRVNIAFLMPFPASTAYHGLEHLENSQVSIDLASKQGTYLFVANIKDHSAAPLSVSPENTTAVAPKSGRNVLPFVFVLAVVVGVAVYFWATRLMSGNSARK